MKSIFITALFATIATVAQAAEQFTGIHTYTGSGAPWMPTPGTGYTTIKTVGKFVPNLGSIPESRVECRGANFWSSEASEAEGVCVFGEIPDRWMLRYRMTDRNPHEQRRERFGRRGNWVVVGGIGRFEGMTGSGKYLAKPAFESEDGVNRTMWTGDVIIPD